MSADTKAKLIGFYRKYPVLIVCIIVSLTLGIFLYTRSGLLEADQARLEQFSAETRRYRANIANAAQLQEQLDFLVRANLAVKDRTLIVGGLAQNLQYFYRLEAETGVKYLDLRPGGKPAGKGLYVPVNQVVTITGSFGQVMKFLRTIEQGDYFCRVNSAVISGSADTATINLNLDLLGTP